MLLSLLYIYNKTDYSQSSFFIGREDFWQHSNNTVTLFISEEYTQEVIEDLNEELTTVTTKELTVTDYGNLGNNIVNPSGRPDEMTTKTTAANCSQRSISLLPECRI